MLKKFTNFERGRLFVSLTLLVLAVFFMLSGSGMAQDIENLPENFSAHADAMGTIKLNLDSLWVLLAAVLVYFMQPGFMAFEAGVVREKTVTSVAFKNLIDWVMVSLAFIGFGFAFMFGPGEGLIGNFVGGKYWFLGGGFADTAGEWGVHPAVFFMFQLGFAGTTATIISGAMAGRTGFVAYLTLSFFVGLFVYPIFGHWVWGSGGWLGEMGFLDYAGSSVVHSTGGWIALMGAWVVGPRLGRYDAEGKLQPFKATSFVWATLGVMILWFGWWGFNGGSGLVMDDQVGIIILNTNSAAAAAGLAAFWHCWIFQDKQDLEEKLLGGILAGLVAITAPCFCVKLWAALVIGLVAGLVHNIAYDLVLKTLRVDDAVGAIPVHGVCGVWGTLSVGIFGMDSFFDGKTNMEQLWVQFVGVAACFVWATATSYLVLLFLKKFVGLRVSPAEEQSGIDIAGEFEDAPEGTESIDEDELKKLMGSGE